MNEFSLSAFLVNLILIFVIYVVIGFAFCFSAWLFCVVFRLDTSWVKKLQRAVLSVRVKKAKKDDKEEESSE